MSEVGLQHRRGSWGWEEGEALEGRREFGLRERGSQGRDRAELSEV